MRIPALALALLALAIPASAQQVPEWVTKTKISGLAFGDAYAVVSHHDPTVEDQNGLWFRRIYLTIDHKQSAEFSSRLRLESSSPGTFDTTTRLVLPFVKDAWLKWNYDRDHAAFIGVSMTPTWKFVEPFWGYRHVEKTPLDLARMGGSREMGLAFQGEFGRDTAWNYHAMIANGTDTNPGKRLLGSLRMAPGEGVVLEVYGDYDNRTNETDVWTLQGFVGFKADWGRAGGLLAHQNRQVPATQDIELDLVSGFVVINLDNGMALIGRIDAMLDPNPGAGGAPYFQMSTAAEPLFFLAGLDIPVGDTLNIIPNIEVVSYSNAVGGGSSPDSDIFLKGTFLWKF